MCSRGSGCKILSQSAPRALLQGHIHFMKTLFLASLFVVPLLAAEHVVPAGMVYIKEGTFQMGSTDGPEDEQPIHEVTVKAFFMDVTEVTNDQFAEFTKATGYLTLSERPLTSKDLPGLLPEFEGKTLGICHRAPEGEAPRRPRLLRRRDGLLQMGREASAHRGGVGIRGTRQRGGEPLCVGE